MTRHTLAIQLLFTCHIHHFYTERFFCCVFPDAAKKEDAKKCPFLNHAKEAGPDVKGDIINLTTAAQVSLQGK